MSLVREINPCFSTTLPDFVREYDVEENGYNLAVGPPPDHERFGDPDARTRNWIHINEVSAEDVLFAETSEGCWERVHEEKLADEADAEYDEWLEEEEEYWYLSSREEEEMDRELWDGGGEYTRYRIGHDMLWSDDPILYDTRWEDLECDAVVRAGMRNHSHNIRHKNVSWEMRLECRPRSTEKKRKETTLRSYRSGGRNTSGLLRRRAQMAKKRKKVVKRGVRERGCMGSTHLAHRANIYSIAYKEFAKRDMVSRYKFVDELKAA